MNRGSSTVWLAILLSVVCLRILSAQQRYLSLDVETGSRLYRNNCFACHGPDGNSIPGVDFRRGQFKRASSDDDLLRVIASGVPGTAMPPRPGAKSWRRRARPSPHSP